MATEKDVESGKPTQLGYYKRLFDQGAVTPEVVNYHYQGEGTEESPYIVKWIENDPRNPMLWPKWYKWVLTQLVAVATLAVAFVSSAYTGGLDRVIVQFGVSQEVVTLGVSLFVLGFALGPLIWAPCSELYGRQILFFGTYAMLTFFNAGAAGSQNIQTLLILRFFAGAFGSSPLTNAGGVIADIFPAAERGLALTLFAAAPFLGPVIGPIVGGFAGETIGWRWVEGIMAIVSLAIAYNQSFHGANYSDSSLVSCGSCVLYSCQKHMPQSFSASALQRSRKCRARCIEVRRTLSKAKCPPLTHSRLLFLDHGFFCSVSRLSSFFRFTWPSSTEHFTCCKLWTKLDMYKSHLLTLIPVSLPTQLSTRKTVAGVQVLVRFHSLVSL